MIHLSVPRCAVWQFEWVPKEAKMLVFSRAGHSSGCPRKRRSLGCKTDCRGNWGMDDSVGASFSLLEHPFPSLEPFSCLLTHGCILQAALGPLLSQGLSVFRVPLSVRFQQGILNRGEANCGSLLSV